MMTRDEAQRVIDLEGDAPTASVTVAACRAVVALHDEVRTMGRMVAQSSHDRRDHDETDQLRAEVASLRAQVADVGWAGEWRDLDGARVRWLRVHGGTEDQTWHLIDEGAISPQASLWRDGFGRWEGRKPHGGALCRPSAAAACEALYPGLTPPAECEP